MASSNSSQSRQLPATPGVSAAPSSPTSARPSSSSSNTNTPSSARRNSNSNRLSMQPTRRSSNVPRPAPIPIPEPVIVQTETGRPSHSSSSGEGPPSTDSTASGTSGNNMHQELEHARAAMAALANGEGSPSTSPIETSVLLANDNSGENTPRNSRSPPTPPTGTGRAIPRPRSAVETGAAMHDSASRPHSSADAWSAQQRPSSANMDQYGNGQSQSPPGGNSRSHSPSADSMLRPTGPGSMPRSRSSNFISSPLNPSAMPPPRRPGSSASRPPSMVLYRLAGIGDDLNPQMSSLAPPVTMGSRRASRFSTMSSSTSIISDSKYPLPVGEDGTYTPPPSGAFLPYEYDPTWDLDAPDDAEDLLHTPDPPGKKERFGAFGLRGVINVCVIFTILSALIVLFALYPVISYYDDQAKTGFFTGSTDTGGGGGGGTSGPARTSSDFVDPDTPEEAKSWTASDGTSYKLVFSDEFNTTGRTFKAGHDPFWQAVDLWDGKNNDLNWYDSDQVTTKDGHLVISLEHKQSNGYEYVSGMLQSWNQFCFTGGYIEVSVSMPGTAQSAGFTPQAYTMGNLARSGFRATEEGLLPYSYDSCDNGVLANQNGDGTISTLPGQRLSACTCEIENTNGEHPGPAGTGGNLRGRGAPQIDILGGLTQGAAGVVSQSVRIAPMSGQQPATGATVEAAADAQLNAYTGDTTQEVVSALTNVPAGSYDGAAFTKYGYQHIPNTLTPNTAAIHFSMEAEETFRVQGSAFPAVTAADVTRRLISNEPMYVVLSLGLSQLDQQPDPTQMQFPAKFLVDYVRVYQPSNAAAKVTCDPSDYPTAAYIKAHQKAYGDATQQTWVGAGYNTPTGQMTTGC